MAGNASCINIIIVLDTVFVVSALFRAFWLSFQKRDKLCKKILKIVKALKMWIIDD